MDSAELEDRTARFSDVAGVYVYDTLGGPLKARGERLIARWERERRIKHLHVRDAER